MKVIDHNAKNMRTFWLMHEVFASGRRTIVRPSPISYEDALKILDLGNMIQLNGAIAWKDIQESDDEFEVMLAAAGVKIDFEVIERHDRHGNCIEYTILDKRADKVVLKQDH